VNVDRPDGLRKSRNEEDDSRVTNVYVADMSAVLMKLLMKQTRQ
jgi:hypothetical protein